MDTFENLSDDFEIEIEEEDGQNAFEEDTKDSSNKETSEEEDGEATSKTDDRTKEEPRKRKSSRANKRIQQLLARQREIENQLAVTAKERDEARKAANQRRTASKEATKNALQTAIDALEVKAAEALEANETTKFLATQREINQKQFELASLDFVDNDEDDTSSTNDNKRSQTQQRQSVQTPEAFEDWAEDKDWLQEPETRHERKLRRFVQRKARELVNEEGYTLEDDDLYDELDDEIQKYISDNNLEIEGYEVKKSEKEMSKATSKQQKETNTSLNSRESTGQGKRKRTVKPTTQDRALAEELGVTLEDFMKQKILREEREKKRSNR